MFGFINTFQPSAPSPRRPIAMGILISFMVAAAITGAGAEPKRYDVRHKFTLRPGGNVDPSVMYVREEYAEARSSAGSMVTPKSFSTPVGMGLTSETANASVPGAVANASTSVNITDLSARLVSGTIRAYGDVEVSLADVDWGYAYASSGCQVAVAAGARLRSGEIVYSPDFKYSSPVYGERSAGRQRRLRDPVTVVKTDLATGHKTGTDLLVIDVDARQGEVAWSNNRFTVTGINAHLYVLMSSPFCAQQGLIDFIVSGGIVTRSTHTGIFAAAPFPPIGALAPIDMPLPSDITMDYDMGGTDDDNSSFEVDFDNGGDVDDAGAATPIYTPANVSLIQEFVSDICDGPDGADQSRILAPATAAGYPCANGLRLADDFTVPTGQNWPLRAVRIPVYLTDPAATITAAHARVWRGTPGAGGVLVAGNGTTNRLMSAESAHAYRINGTAQSEIRTLLIDLSFVPTLTPATYWIDFDATSTSGAVYAVPQTPARAGSNGRQMVNPVSGTWVQLADGGMGVDFPFVLIGKVATFAATDLGTISTANQGALVHSSIGPSEVKWYRFSLFMGSDDALGTYLDIDTIGSVVYRPSMPPTDDTLIGLYDAAGNLVVSDDDDGPGYTSQLSFGQRTPARPPAPGGMSGDGRDGTLPPGDYYLGVGVYPMVTLPFGFNATSTAISSTELRVNFTTNMIQCPGDYNSDGGIDGADVADFFSDWEAGDSAADINGDGGVDGGDVAYFFERWEAGC